MSFASRLACIVGVLIGLGGCASTPDVNTDYNPSFDFGGKTRFAVLRPERALAMTGKQTTVMVNDLLAERLTIAVERGLEERGYQIVPVEKADMIVTFYVTRENKVDVRTYNTGFTYGRCVRVYGCGAWANPQQVEVKNYQEGTLLIDFIDTASKSLQWRGVTSKRLPSKASRADRDTLTKEAVSAILAQYPPGSQPEK